MAPASAPRVGRVVCPQPDGELRGVMIAARGFDQHSHLRVLRAPGRAPAGIQGPTTNSNSKIVVVTNSNSNSY